ncbi:MAG: hypothetical protein ACKVQT_24555 [Burkholderiales bacterium]
MPSAGFFGWLWKFNALAIAVAATGAIVVLGLLAVGFVSSWWGRGDWRHETGLVERGQSEPQKVKYALDRGTAVEGAAYMLHSLQRYTSEPNALPIKSSYLYDSRTVNLLLVDGAGAKGRWLFDGVRQVIGVKNKVFDPANLGSIDPQRRATALIVEVFSTDTNKDDEIDFGDDVSLFAYRFDTGARVELLKGPIAIVSVRQIDDGKIVVMYEVGEKTVVANFDGKDFRPLAKGELPRLSTERPTDHNAPEITGDN